MVAVAAPCFLGSGSAASLAALRGWEGGLLDLFELFHLLPYRAVEVGDGLVLGRKLALARGAAYGRVGDRPHLVPADACVNVIHDILQLKERFRGMFLEKKGRQLVDTARP